MDTICKFTTGKNAVNLIPQYFVYEASPDAFDEKICNTFNLYLISEGSGLYDIGNNKYPIEKGDLILTYPQIPYRFEGNSLRCYYISFFGTAVPDTLQLAGLSSKHPIRHNCEEYLKFWARALSKCRDENLFFMANSVLMYTLGSLISRDASPKDSGESLVVSKIVEYTCKNFSDPDLTLSQICRQFFYNQKYISSLFRQKMGVTFSKFLVDLRINHARGFFNNGFTSVKEVAFLSGFSDALYFSKAFKLLVGVTPAVYLRQLKESKEDP